MGIGRNMSHLIIEQGKDVGREVTVPAGGMKFGRSPANELVLDDDAVMLFHGRFFFKSDGSLWVTDFGAGQKTTVGGQPIDEHQLKTGDLVEVGNTAFRIIGTSRGDAEAAPAPVESPAPVTRAESKDEGEHIDLGFKHSGRSPKADAATGKQGRSTLIHRWMQVGIPLLVLLVLAALGSMLLQTGGSSSATSQQGNTLALTYERVRADTNNIFRYYIQLDDKGVLSIQIDELKTHLHFQKSKQLSTSLLTQLSHGIEDAGFFKVDSDYAGTAQGQYDLFDLAVKRNRRYHRIRVLNNRFPSSIERTQEVLEEFASRELNIPFTMTMPSRERIRYGLQALELAKTRFAERDVRHMNLAESIKHYNEALLFLQDIEEKREQYEEAEAGLDEAAQERDNRYDDYMFRADHSIALQEWQAAYKNLQILQELVPDREDPRHDKINDKLMSVERHLR